MCTGEGDGEPCQKATCGVFSRGLENSAAKGLRLLLEDREALPWAKTWFWRSLGLGSLKLSPRYLWPSEASTSVCLAIGGSLKN